MLAEIKEQLGLNLVIDFIGFYYNRLHEKAEEEHTNTINNAANNKSISDKPADDPSHKILKKSTRKTCIYLIRRGRTEQRNKVRKSKNKSFSPFKERRPLIMLFKITAIFYNIRGRGLISKKSILILKHLVNINKIQLVFIFEPFVSIDIEGYKRFLDFYQCHSIFDQIYVLL